MKRRDLIRLLAAASGLPPAGRSSAGEGRRLFYEPADGAAADFVPFYWKGKYYLFYLHDYRDPKKYGTGVPWRLITTSDFVRFAEHGDVLARGRPDEQDHNVYTGCVLEAGGLFHIYYVGHNRAFRTEGKRQQAIMRATSPDLLHWTKQPGELFYAPPGFEPHDWRDPFVFWHERERRYWMIVATRRPPEASRLHGGANAICVSTDLRRWEYLRDLYAPGLYPVNECPDLFRIGSWWYLVFSEFGVRWHTRYRMARSLDGPWLTPEDDLFDDRMFYAAKTASDGKRRFLFGWMPTLKDGKDAGRIEWGGSLVVHEVVQRADGTLAVRIPEEVARSFPRKQECRFQSALGPVHAESGGVRIDSPGEFSWAAAGRMPDRFKVEIRVRFERPTQAFGLLLRAAPDRRSGYAFRFEPARNRVRFHEWPVAKPCFENAMECGWERALPLRGGQQMDLTLLVDGSACVLYAGGEYALSARMYDLPAGDWGVFAEQGQARFLDARVWTREGD
jgi:beta-fructofuranosidase